MAADALKRHDGGGPKTTAVAEQRKEGGDKMATDALERDDGGGQNGGGCVEMMGGDKMAAVARQRSAAAILGEVRRRGVTSRGDVTGGE